MELGWCWEGGCRKEQEDARTIIAFDTDAENCTVPAEYASADERAGDYV